MLATFCLRLAAGLIAWLVILDPKPIPPRFFRVHHLTALGLLAVAGFFLRDLAPGVLTVALIAGMALTFAGAVVWHLDQAPAGTVINLLAALALLCCLMLANVLMSAGHVHTIDDFASAALLGSATTAMLLGHSYLISPAMTIAPLLRMLAALGAALVIRIVLACWGLSQWTAGQPLANLETENLLWLSARWLLGLLAPLVLGWMAWESARIRSTQSATGILYVVVIVCFLGELTSLLLREKTGSIL
jgi:hypothetical protein